MYLSNIPPYFRYNTRKTDTEILKEYRNYLVKVFKLVIPTVVKKPISTIKI